MFQSETGTGKTYAYLLPLISKLLREDANGIYFDSITDENEWKMVREAIMNQVI